MYEEGCVSQRICVPGPPKLELGLYVQSRQMKRYYWSVGELLFKTFLVAHDDGF